MVRSCPSARRERKTIRHGHRQRLRMPGPGQQNFLPTSLASPESSSCPPPTDRDDASPIRDDDRHLRVFGEAARIGSARSSSQSCKAANAALQSRAQYRPSTRTTQRRVQSCQHPSRAGTMFQRPARSARLEHDGVSAQLLNPDLHRRARAQTGIEEDQRDRAAARGFD